LGFQPTSNLFSRALHVPHAQFVDLAGEVSIAAPLALAEVIHDVRWNRHAASHARGADEALNPASNTKLLTTLAALALLGPEYRWKTALFGAPPASGVIPGDLVLKGYGDPTLQPAELWRLVAMLAAQGVRRVAGNKGGGATSGLAKSPWGDTSRPALSVPPLNKLGSRLSIGLFPASTSHCF
jgi:hypothetical protein